jgi:hypothetical protein
MQWVKVHLASDQPEELITIFAEAIDEAFHEIRNAEWPLSQLLSHQFFGCRLPRHLSRIVQSCILQSILRMPTSKNAIICSLSIRTLDVGQLSIRSSSFRDYFLLKNIHH